MGGYDRNFCCLGADPSNGGKVSDMRTDATSHHYIGPVADNNRPDEPSIDDIERDLADVEAAMSRLEAGTYWTCEVSGRPLPDSLLESDPLIRRLPS